MEHLIQIGYIIASAFFIIGLKMMGKIPTAKAGNRLSAIGMLLAIVITLLANGMDYRWVIAGIAIGTAIGAWMALGVKMTQMPEMVGLMNGLGGLASMLVGWAEYEKISQMGWNTYVLESSVSPYFSAGVIYLAIFIGAITFTGSLFAFGKLSGLVSGKPVKIPLLQGLVNLFYAILAIGFFAFIYLAGAPELAAYAMPTFIATVVISLLMGLLIVMPIGGGDMPVVIAMLNSFSGLAACASGFVIQNTLLIVAGCLVGVSGVVLSIIMCKAMNRTLFEVFMGGFGGDGAAAVESAESTDEIKGELKPISEEDAYYLFEAARNVVIVPGYGMAVAQAQHAIKELATILEENGAEVRFAIHPVAGRMPGHMNVLLAEADVSYDQLWEMDAINPQLPTVDLALVVGANDVVNPAAAMDKSSPLYGMPIINVHQARTVICMKRGKGTGFSGLENKLFLLPNSRMLYGDAKNTVNGLVSQFKQAAS